MASTEHYDALIIGRSLAGMLCAALLAHRKLRVRVISPAGPPAPEPVEPIFGVKTAPVFNRILDEIGLVHALRTRLDGPPRAITVALADRRLTLEPERAARGRELSRALPEARAELMPLFERVEGYGADLDGLLDGRLELPAEGFGGRRALRRAATGLAARELLDGRTTWTTSPLLGRLVDALLAVAGRADEAGRPITPGGARALWHLCHGAASVRGDREGLLEMVTDKLSTYGGTFEPARRVRDLEIRRKKVVAAHGANGTRYSAEVVVFAGDDAALARLCPNIGLPATRAARSLTAHIPAAERPEGLRDPCGWVTDETAPPFVVRVGAEAIRVAYAGDGEPPDLAALTPFATGAIDPPSELLRPSCGVTGDTWGLFRVPIRTPLRNLLRVGAWVIPGLGVEGDALSAWQAARLAERICPRRRA